MGSWFFVHPRFENLCSTKVSLRRVADSREIFRVLSHQCSIMENDWEANLTVKWIGIDGATLWSSCLSVPYKVTMYTGLVACNYNFFFFNEPLKCVLNYCLI